MDCGNYWLQKTLNDEINEYAEHEREYRSLWFSPNGSGCHRNNIPDVIDLLNLPKCRVRLDIMTFGKTKMTFALNVEVVESPLKDCQELQRGEGSLKLRISSREMTPKVWNFLNMHHEKITAILWYESCVSGTWTPTKIHTMQNMQVSSYRTTNFPSDDCVEVWLKHNDIRGNAWK